ncbi:RGS domain-containing protein [Fennellomyces sp. T-0311]|nr:RGS domain-containing protein [Fennellomyces sp. T-0311]
MVTAIPTLESVLDNQATDFFHDFQVFMHQTFCTENLTFWLAVQRYQKRFHEGDESECQTIVRNHIRPNSTQEINIPCEMRQEILQQVEEQNYHPTVFTAAVDSVVELMRANSYIPFVQQKQQQQQQQQLLLLLQQQQQRHVLTSSVSCPSISSSASSGSVFARIKRSLLGSSKRPYASLPSTPRTSAESFRRSWSPWRKLL